MARHDDDADKDESRTAETRSEARDHAIPARVWGDAGMGQWEGPNAAEVASFGGVVRPLIKWLGMPLGVGLAFAAHALGVRGPALLVVLLLGFPTIAIVAALWGLRSRNRARAGMLVLGRRRIQFRGNGAPSEIEFDRIKSFHVADGAGSSVLVTFRLDDGQSFFAELAARDAPRVIVALDERLPSALSGTGLRPMLSRGRRDLSSWRATVQSLSTGGTYRGGSIPIEHLLSAVCDTRLSAEERIGAALALSGRGSEHRERLRIAAQEVKTPDLRVAIEHVADETVDDSVIAVAIEEEATRSRH